MNVNDKKLYLFLYYFALIMSIFVCIICIVPSISKASSISITYSEFLYNFVQLSGVSLFLIFTNVILIVIFMLFLLKRNLNSVNIFFPIVYVVFTVIVLVTCLLFNNRLLEPHVQYPYYLNFIQINYILLNIHSILSFNKKQK